MNEIFHKISSKVSSVAGHPSVFIFAITIIIIWALSGPTFGYSNTWQLVINTGTTIVTFLMVFLIQNTQNRDSTAVHLKLDELLKLSKGNEADELIDIENVPDEELEKLKNEFKQLHEHYAKELDKRGKTKT
jgi:low affinity Fe/Cu permease